MQATTRVPTRWTQARAFALAVGGLVAGLVVAGALALGWLLVRTRAGLVDVAESDAVLGAALVLAIPPAWFAWMATRGAQRGAGLRPWMRMLASWVALPLWAWLGLVSAAAGLTLVALALIVIWSVVCLRALALLVRWITHPPQAASERHHS